MGSELRRRFVFDVNSLVSAFLFPDSTPGQAFQRVILDHTLLMSLELAAEATEVLRREKFDRYLHLARREALLAGTIHVSEFVRTTTNVTDCRDADDNRILELAVDGLATAIVSGDADLLALDPYREIRILTPRAFLEQ
jgi:putative PIN family toxin of toxin-antitoxin system